MKPLTRYQKQALVSLGFIEDLEGCFNIGLNSMTDKENSLSNTSGFYVENQEQFKNLLKLIYEDGYETGQMYPKKKK